MVGEDGAKYYKIYNILKSDVVVDASNGLQFKDANTGNLLLTKVIKSPEINYPDLIAILCEFGDIKYYYNDTIFNDNHELMDMISKAHSEHSEFFRKYEYESTKLSNRGFEILQDRNTKDVMFIDYMTGDELQTDYLYNEDIGVYDVSMIYTKKGTIWFYYRDQLYDETSLLDRLSNSYRHDRETYDSYVRQIDELLGCTEDEEEE